MPGCIGGRVGHSVKSSKLNDILVFDWAFRGLARMLLKMSEKGATAPEETARGDVQMPANIQLTA
jgi:hypothetical protein